MSDEFSSSSEDPQLPLQAAQNSLVSKNVIPRHVLEMARLGRKVDGLIENIEYFKVSRYLHEAQPAAASEHEGRDRIDHVLSSMEEKLKGFKIRPSKAVSNQGNDSGIS